MVLGKISGRDQLSTSHRKDNMLQVTAFLDKLEGK
jgi:hypothetical protein